MQYSSRAFAVLAAVLLVSASFTPVAYATHREGSDDPNYARRYAPRAGDVAGSRAACGGGSDSAVWVTELTGEQYANLLKSAEATAKTKLQSFGDQGEQERQDALDKANLPSNPTASRVENQMLLNTKGEPIFLYDVVKHSQKDPNTKCHLNRLITEGYIQYAARVDENTRYCSPLVEREGSTCQAGTPIKTADAGTLADRAGAFVGNIGSWLSSLNPWDMTDEKLRAAAELNSYVTSTSAQDVNFDGYVKPRLERLGWNPSAPPLAGAPTEVEVESDLRQKSKVKLSLLASIVIGKYASEQKKETNAVFNFVESTKTSSFLFNQADFIFMFPESLANYFYYLQSLEGEEEATALFAAAEQATAFGGMGLGIRQALLSGRGVQAAARAKWFANTEGVIKPKWIRTFEQTSEDIDYLVARDRTVLDPLSNIVNGVGGTPRPLGASEFVELTRVAKENGLDTTKMMSAAGKRAHFLFDIDPSTPIPARGTVGGTISTGPAGAPTGVIPVETYYEAVDNHMINSLDEALKQRETVAASLKGITNTKELEEFLAKKIKTVDARKHLHEMIDDYAAKYPSGNRLFLYDRGVTYLKSLIDDVDGSAWDAARNPPPGLSPAGGAATPNDWADFLRNSVLSESEYGLGTRTPPLAVGPGIGKALDGIDDLGAAAMSYKDFINNALFQHGLSNSLGAGSKSALVALRNVDSLRLPLKSLTGTQKISRYLFGAAGRFVPSVRFNTVLANIAFFLNVVGRTGPPIFVLNTLGTRIDMSAETNVDGRTSYIETIVMKPLAVANLENYRVWPTNLGANLYNFFLSSWFGSLEDIFPDRDAGERGIIKKKLARLGDHVIILDQELEAGELAPSAFNIVVPVEVGGTRKWMFFTRSKANALAYQFEHPDNYVTSGTNKYTAMGVYSRNVPVSAMTLQATADWAQLSAGEAAALVPDVWSWALASVVGSFFNVGKAAGIGRQAGGAFLTIILLKLLGSITQKGVAGGIAQEIRDAHFGQLVQPKEAYATGKHCEANLEAQKQNVRGALTLKEATTGILMALDILDIVVTRLLPATGGISLIAGGIITAGSVITSFADQAAAENYLKVKKEGVESFKDCYETSFTFFGFQTIATAAGSGDDIAKVFADATKGITDFLGPAVEAFTPQTRDEIKSYAQNYDYQTIALQSTLKGANQERISATEVFNMHFDRETEINWYLDRSNPSCNLQLCYGADRAVGSGASAFKCMTTSSQYALLDENGEPIILGPQALRPFWFNDQQVAGITQKVINIERSPTSSEPVLTITKAGVDFDAFNGGCTADKISGIAGLRDKSQIGQLVGGLSLVYTVTPGGTPQANIWITPDNRIAINPLQEITGFAGFGQMRYIDLDDQGKAGVTLLRNGDVLVKDSNGDTVMRGTLGESGFIKFQNADILPGSAQHEFDQNYDGNRPRFSLEGAEESAEFAAKKHRYSVYIGNENVPVFHLFIFNLVSGIKPSSYGAPTMRTCQIMGRDDEVIGTGVTFTLDIPEGSPQKEELERFNSVMENSCLRQFDTQQGPGTLDLGPDGKGTYTGPGPDGKTGTFNVDGFENGCLKMVDAGGKTVYMCMDKDASGPRVNFANAPGAAPQFVLPLLGGNGLGSSFLNGANGLSLANTFNFPIIPLANQMGMGGSSGLFFAQPSPFGSRTKEEVIKPLPPINPIAALPSAPEPETNPAGLILFIVAIAAGILLVRMNAPLPSARAKQKGRKR